ncbi:MAG: heavy metal translocating P-type ATPase [Sulfuricella sp.]
MEKHFCCIGCARVYQIAHENNMLDQVLARPQPEPSGFVDVIFKPGETAYFSIGGMWCAGCAVAAEQVLRNQPGIKNVDVSFAAERGRIQYDPAQVNPASALQRLDGLGYRSRLLSDAGEQRAERGQERTLLQLITAAAFGMQVMSLYITQLYPLYATRQFNAPEVRQLQYLVWLLATPVFFYGGSSFLRGAWRALSARTATMDTLVALGTLSAYGYSVYVTLTGSGEVYFDSVTMITTFVMLGRYLETLGGAEARKGIRRLLSLQPDKAWRRVGDVWQEVPGSALSLGDIILVKPGQRVPADAEIREGQAALDEALLTGESAPVHKGPGDMVFAGTLVTDSALTCRVTRLAQDTRLAHITQLVEQTLAAKPPIQRLADKASAYFTFGILGIAVITFLGWWSTGHTPAQGLLAAVAVLVVACPCALGLATPFALTVTLGRTTQAGILVRNPVALETAADIQRIVFDKTGTLTRGQMTVVATAVNREVALAGDDLLCLAAAVEQYSEHPVAKAIVAACSNPLAVAGEFQALRGLGASARVVGQADRRVMVGSLRFLGANGYSPLIVQAQSRAEQGQSVVWVGWDEVTAGFIALRDEPNPTAGKALRQLQVDGIRPVMLSGDSPRTTQAIAAELGLAEYEGNCTPAEKAARIQAWQAAGERVGMVGDGVNDAPALAQADLSITVAGGTDVAGETSDVVLTRPDLTLVPWFIRLCHRTRRIIRQNLGWAFAYNLLVVPLAALGIISPVIAAVTMATSSVLVVGNSLRLRH